MIQVRIQVHILESETQLFTTVILC